jgi:4-hydroxy-tetrahydrodipicolinate synthase
MTTAAPFGRLLTAMATAFHDDGSVDLDATARIAHHLVENGNDGVVVSGTTGESPTTSVAEDGQILQAVVDAVGDRASVIAGVGTNATAHSVELAEQAAKIGADGVLLVTPYYSKPSPAGVLIHFRSVAQATDLPVMLYDVPGRTGLPIARVTYERASELPTVTSVKEATGNPAQTVLLTELGYSVYCGDDAATLGYLAYGADGLVSVVGHAAGRELKAMIEAFAQGNTAEALRIHTRLAPAFDAVMGVANYGATTAKAALELLGVLDNRNVRGPLVPLDDDEVTALRAGLAASGLI